MPDSRDLPVMTKADAEAIGFAGFNDVPHTFAETIRTDPVTLAREYLSARDATEHEFQSEEARDAYVVRCTECGLCLTESEFPALIRLNAKSRKTPFSAVPGDHHCEPLHLGVPEYSK